MRIAIWVLVACFVAGLALSNPRDELKSSTQYGVAVFIEPDEEFSDFIRCRVSIFALFDKFVWFEPSAFIT